MAIYDFKCDECGDISYDISLPMMHEPSHRPECCGKPKSTFITQPPMAHFKDYDLPDGGYTAYSMPRNKDGSFPVVTSRRQSREMMKRHNLVNANDAGPAPSFKDQSKERDKINESIAAITPSGEIAKDMKDRGILDIVN